MAKPLTRPIAVADLKLALARKVQDIYVFVAGPFVKREWSPEERASLEPAVSLRLAIIEHIERELSYVSVLGEDHGLTELAKKTFGSQATALIAEIALIDESCEAVIIVPASPGSFCELGSWATIETICPKMLILADSKYRLVESYMNLGVYLSAQNAGAVLEWIDYGSTDEALAIAERFIAERLDRLMVRRSLGRA